MKRLFCVLVCLLMLTGCAGKTAVDLMPEAEPATSALALYIYDGETITRQFLFETEQVREEALADFRKAKAEPVEVDVTTLQPPYYGLEMGGEEKGTIYGLWADGYFIRGDGKTFRFDYDFETLLTGYSWELEQEYENLMLMPCAAYMAKTEAGWNRNFLTAAEEKPVPEGITMEIEKQKNDEIIAVFHNRSGEEWGFGHAFSLQVLLDEQWYYVPAEDGNYAFTEELLIVPNGESREEPYHLDVYGTLFPGIYRIVSTEGLWVEFEMM